MFNQALTLSAALLLWSPSLEAQQSHQHPSGTQEEAGMTRTGGMGQDTMGMMGGDMGMMASSAPGPAMLIRMGEVLELSEKQTTELEAIHAELKADRASHMPLAMEAHKRAAELIADGEADLAEYEDILREAMDHMISLHVLEARATLDARAVLTDEQRARLAGAMAMMKHMRSMESMMDGGMPGMPGQNSEPARHERAGSSEG